MYAIEMLNITKKFGDFYANKDITIQVKKNEVHALLGENGAGKSTLMSVLFGIIFPLLRRIDTRVLLCLRRALRPRFYIGSPESRR